MEIAAHQQVKFLIRAAKLDIGIQCYRVISLHERIEQLVKRDRLFLRHPFCKIVAFQNLFNRCFRAEFYEIGGRKFVHPLAVKAQLRFLRIKQLKHLPLIGFGVCIYLLTRERRPRHILSRRVADHPRKIADQKNHRMPKVLKRLQFANHNRMPHMNIRRRWVEAELYTQRFTGLCGTLKFFPQIFLTNEVNGAFF